MCEKCDKLPMRSVPLISCRQNFFLIVYQKLDCFKINMVRVVYFFVAFLTVAIFPSGEALKCYSCNSYDDTECWEPTEKHLKDCGPADQFNCMVEKYNVAMEESSLSAEYEYRSCERKSSTKFCPAAFCRSCATDGCNRAFDP